MAAQWESNKMYYRVSDYDDRESMFADIFVQIEYLLRHDNWVTAYPAIADNNVYVVEFASQDPTINKHIPVWMTPSEVIRAAEANSSPSAKDTEEDIIPDGGTGGSHAA